MFTWLLALALADTCPTWSPADDPFEVKGGIVSESSGLAASRARPGVLYTHDDKGGAAELYAFDLDGKYLGEHDVRGAQNLDWEDLAAAPCPDKGDCVYIGDIGDNDRRRDSIAVHIAREPDGEGGAFKVMRTLEGSYPDDPQDAEALLVHPCTGDVYVVTKTGDTFISVYRFPEDSHKGQPPTLILVSSFELPGSEDARKVTGGDFDVDGDRVVLRSLELAWEWEVDPSDPEVHWNDAARPIDLPLVDSEAITYTLDGDLIASSEGSPMTMNALPCESPEPSAHVCDFPYEPGCACATSGSSPVPTGFLVLFFMLYSRGRLDT